MYLYTVGQNIQKYRKLANITQAELSFLSSIDTSHLGKIERGQWNATLATLNRIAMALKIDLYKLFNQGDERCPDYTILNLFIKVCVPYTEKLEIYDPLRLGEFFGAYLFDKITIQDMENAATLYLDSITYEIVEEKCTDPDLGTYLTYAIRAVRKTNSVESQILYRSDVCPNRCKVEALVREMNQYHVYPIHFDDIIEDFVSNDFSPPYLAATGNPA